MKVRLPKKMGNLTFIGLCNLLSCNGLALNADFRLFQNFRAGVRAGGRAGAWAYIRDLHHIRFPGKRRPSLGRRLIEQEAKDAAGYDDGDGTDFAEE